MNAQLTGPDSNRNVAAKKLGNQFGFTDRLDYIFVKNNIEINSAKIVGLNPPYASDHAGVVASLVINQGDNLISPTLDAHQPFPISFWQWVGIFLILLITWVFWHRYTRKLMR
jgi:hypothetical protein